MDALAGSLIRLRTDLRSLGVRWALIGGLAVSIRTEPRTTRDIDVATAVHDDREAEEMVRELFDRGYGFVGQLEHKDKKRLATVRASTPRSVGFEVVIDLLFASSGIEVEIVHEAELLEVFPHVQAPVARTGHLIALKILAARPERPQDVFDARALVQTANPSEIRRARAALDLIDRRGYHRDQDLQAKLEELLASVG